MFDQDGNGYIEQKELDQMMGGVVDDDFWLQILKECDVNKDGKISM